MVKIILTIIYKSYNIVLTPTGQVNIQMHGLVTTNGLTFIMYTDTHHQIYYIAVG